MPIYNVEKYVEKCLLSIINQSWKDWELIVVNDGTTDTSRDICELYARQDTRIKIVDQENKGLSAARNYGLNVAKGKYIAFVDSDDYVHPQMYELLLSSFQKNDIDVSICDYMPVNEGETINPLIIDNPDYTILSQKEILSGLLNEFGMLAAISWNKIYKKALFDNIRFPEGKIYEDAYIMHLVYDKCKRVSYLPQKLYFYTQREKSIMTGTKLIKKLDAIDAYSQWYNYFNSKNNEVLKRKSAFKVIRTLQGMWAKGITDLEFSEEAQKKKKEIARMNLDAICSQDITVKSRINIIMFILFPKLSIKLYRNFK